ncbi:G0/G1 switch protein 2-like [Sinocyclocheilus rhinocerous]|uniref:G0/G1 switch protein 2-like n=1 Tax=Sinocyclocheilus rhinocerous TaxID=307959 RepID=A0A673ISP7_9TELE|nr:PREDICTED: G0/G1 switch protein 2-like [Sinocyclocheilus rhinocerous]
MDTMHELIPFAKEMLSAGPSKGSLKVYLVGGMFAVLGMVSGVVQVASSLFPDHEEPDFEMLKVRELIPVKEQVQEPQTSIPEDEEMDEVMEAEAKGLPVNRQRRMSFRAHAS